MGNNIEPQHSRLNHYERPDPEVLYIYLEMGGGPAKQVKRHIISLNTAADPDKIWAVAKEHIDWLLEGSIPQPERDDG